MKTAVENSLDNDLPVDPPIVDFLDFNLESSGSHKRLSDPHGSPAQSQFVYDRLKDIGQTAQIAFLQKNNLAKNGAV